VIATDMNFYFLRG